MNIKNIHERIRERVDAVEDEMYELRGKTKNFHIIQRYTRKGEEETEEIFISSPEINISVVIRSKGVSSATFVRGGQIEGKNLSEEEVQKIIDEIVKMLSSS